MPKATMKPDLWPQLFSDVSCIALWISSEKILTRLYSVLHWFHKRLEANVKKPRENRCFQIVIVFSFSSFDNSKKCTVLLKIAARLITVSTSVNKEMWVKLSYETASNLAPRLKGTTDDRAAVRLLARASVHLGRDSSALSLFERIGNRSMMADDLYLLGVALSRTGNDKGSTEVWKQGLRADPDHPQILHGMIKVNLKMDRFFEAAAEARRLAKQPAWQARANELLGRIQYARNDPAGAVEFWQRRPRA